MIHVRHCGDTRIGIVEPAAKLLVVVTVYGCPNDRAVATSHLQERSGVADHLHLSHTTGG